MVTVRVADYNYYDLVGEVVGKDERRKTKDESGKRRGISLPVMGAVKVSVEARGKGG